jgi:ubiquinol-cytochrome c reductase cytochrome c subunit
MTATSRILLALTLIASIVLLAAGHASAQPPSGIVRPSSEPPGASVSLGAELYAGNCASCHGASGGGIAKPRPGAGGIEGAGPALSGAGAQAADFYLRTGFMPLPEIHAQPARRRVLFTEKELRSLIAFVASLGPGPPIPQPQPRAGDLAEGFSMFTAHCAGCHQSVAQGGFVPGARVPPLHSSTAVQIAEAVRIGPYLMPRFSKHQISDAQLNSIIAYVLSTSHPDNRGGWSIGNIGPIPEGIIAWVAAVALAIACVGLGRRLRR